MEKETVKGFRDFSGQESLKREKIKQIIVEKFKTYGFTPAETPIIEQEEFVKQGNQNDEAISDIFRLKDKGQRNLALRYEFTFQLKRLAENKKLPYKRYQIGEVFRDEPVSSNRFRQFTQCDIDIIGSTARDEAEILKLSSEILNELGIKATILINNRKLLNEILEELRIKNKERVMKEIDKLECKCKFNEKDIIDNLKQLRAEKIIKILANNEKFFEKYENYSEIKKLKEFCKLYGVKVEFSPSLARGLSYYNGSIFEIKTLDMKESICGGGSYLVNGIQSTGISFGLDRISQLAKVNIDSIKCIIISINQEKESINFAEELRKNNISCLIMDKISKALEYANLEKIPYTIFIGQEELNKKKFKLRNMKTGKELLINKKEIINKLNS